MLLLEGGMGDEGSRLVVSGFVSVMGDSRKLNFNISEETRNGLLGKSRLLWRKLEHRCYLISAFSR
jgi:hypothetical protein